MLQPATIYALRIMVGGSLHGLERCRRHVRKPFGARFLTSSAGWNGVRSRSPYFDENPKMRAGVTSWSLLETLHVIENSSEHGVTAGVVFSRVIRIPLLVGLLSS